MRSILLFALVLPAAAQTPDWTKVNEEAMRHYQALVRIDCPHLGGVKPSPLGDGFS